MPTPEPTEPSAPKRETTAPSVGHAQRIGAGADAAGGCEVDDRVVELDGGRAAREWGNDD